VDGTKRFSKMFDIAEYDVPEDACITFAKLQRDNAFSMLMEIALQPCGC